MKSGNLLALLLPLFCLVSCNPPEKNEEISVQKEPKEFYIVPGEDEEFDPEQLKKGEVLVAYSDCYQCHREESKAKGPSFSDIARRYPLNQTYIDLLSRKVITGGSGTWGYPVMSPHPKLSIDEAKLMVSYILSLEIEHD